MSGHPASLPLRALAWALFAVGLTGDIIGLVDSLPGRTELVSASTVSQFAGVLVLGSVGVLLAIRRPDNPLGWIFLATYATFGLSGAFTVYLSAEPADRTLADLALWLTNWLWVPVIGVVVLFPLLLFPDGRFQGPAWRRLGWVGALVIVAMSAGLAFGSADFTDPDGHPVHNPYAPGRGGVLFDLLRFVGAIGLVVLVIAALVGLFRRFRYGDEVTRAQLKWFFAAGAVWLFFLGYPGDHGDGGVIDVFIGVALAALPAAVGLAVLRYHLYDIDRIVSRTTSYVVVSALVLATYGVVVSMTLRVVPGSSNLAVAAATLSAAAIARPAVRRVQRVVDRRFDRTRYDQQRTVELFGDGVRNVVDPGDVGMELLRTVKVTLQPSRALLWLGPRAEGRP